MTVEEFEEYARFKAKKIWDERGICPGCQAVQYVTGYRSFAQTWHNDYCPWKFEVTDGRRRSDNA